MHHQFRARTEPRNLLGRYPVMKLIMATEEIIGGPAKDECQSRMLARQPVTFLVSGGSVEILIERVQELNWGDRLAFVGQIVADGDTGARVGGHYDCSTKSGSLVIDANHS
jgi:hypothetical protein